MNYSDLVEETTKCEFSSTFKVILCFLLLVTGLLSFIENIFFCVVVFINKKLQVQSNILIISLSITDIIISITVPVFEFIYVLANPQWPLGRVGTNIQNLLWMFSIITPFMTVTAITIDRYLAITKNIQYKTLVTPFKIGITLATIWVYSLIWVIVMATNFDPAPEDEYVWNVPKALYYIFLGMHIIFPLGIISILYRKIISTVKLSRRSAGVVQVQKSDVKLAKTVAFVIIFLFAVWAPVVVLEVIYNFDFYNCIIEQVGTVSVWITCVNGALNPMVYSYRNEEVKKYLMKMFRCFKTSSNNTGPLDSKRFLKASDKSLA